MVSDKMDPSLIVRDKRDHISFTERMDESVVNSGQKMDIAMKEQDARADSEPEYEPFDTKKQEFIDEELMDKVQNQMELVTHLRKTCPSKIKGRVKKVYKKEWGHLTRCQVHVTNSETIEDSCSQLDKLLVDSADSINQDSIDERLGACSIKVDDMKKNVKDILSKTKELVKSKEMYKRLQGSQMYRLIYETPTNTPEKGITDPQCSSNTVFNVCINSNLNI